MSAFSHAELAYLIGERHLGRLATVGADGMPHVTPVGWSYNPEHDSIDVGGRDPARTKKFRDVARTGRAAIVVDEVLPPWRPRGVEVRGRAEAIESPAPLIRIHPGRVVSWGMDEMNRGGSTMYAIRHHAFGPSGKWSSPPRPVGSAACSCRPHATPGDRGGRSGRAVQGRSGPGPWR